MDFGTRLEKARKIPELFELSKEIVKEFLGVEQAGLLVGISDLGMSKHGFVGAFYSLNANMIILNKRALKTVMDTNPELHRHYAFYIILHEYLHSIGSYDEMQTRQLALEITHFYFGKEHPCGKLATHINEFLIEVSRQATNIEEPIEHSIEFVHGIDRKNTNYIN